MNDSENYEIQDSILSLVRLSNPATIKIEITDQHVFLFVGPRDWQWDRKSGVMIGCGTELSNPVQDEGVER